MTEGALEFVVELTGRAERYQRGILSYPRTETDKFPPTMDLQALVVVQTASAEWGAYLQPLQPTRRAFHRRWGKVCKAPPER